MPQNLIVVGFNGTHRAAEVLSQIQRLRDNWTSDLADAIAAYRTDDGRLRIDQSVQAANREAAEFGVLVGGLLGTLLAANANAGSNAAAAAATPGAGGASGGFAGAAIGAEDAATWKEKYGVADEFVSQVGGLIQPGDSVIFARLSAASPDLVSDKFRGYGGRIIRTTISPRQAERAQRTLNP